MNSMNSWIRPTPLSRLLRYRDVRPGAGPIYTYDLFKATGGVISENDTFLYA